MQSGFLQSFNQDFRTFPSQRERGREGERERRREGESSSPQHRPWGEPSAVASLICPSRTLRCQLGAILPQQSQMAEVKEEGRAVWRINGELQSPNSSKCFRCPTSVEEKSGPKGNPGVSCLRRLCPVFLGNVDTLCVSSLGETTCC